MADNISFDLELTTKAFEAAIAQATRSIEGFTKGLEKSTDEAAKDLEDVGEAGKDAGKDVAKGGDAAAGAWDTFKGVLGAEAVVGAFNFIKDAALGLFDTFVVEGVAGAQEAEAAMVKLKSALEISGDAANGTLEDFQAFAAQLQKNTSADGDAVIAQLALAKQYGLTNEQAKKVVETATDMAARGYDADNSVRQLAESFSGQAGKLAKLNPLLKDLSEEQLKAGAAAEILGNQFAGSAAAQVETFEGSLTQAKNAFGDLQEEIGFLIIQNPAVVGAIQEAVKAFQVLSGWVSDNKEQIGELVTQGVGLLVTAFKEAVSAGLALVTFMKENQAVIEAVAVGLSVATGAYIAYTLAVNGAAIAMGVATAAQVALNFALTANPIGVVIVALGALAAAVYYVATNFDEVATAMVGFAGFALQSMVPAIQAIIDTIQPLVNVFDEELAASLDQAAITVQEKAQALLDIQEEGESLLAQKREEALAKQKADDDAANAAKLAGQAETNAGELAAESAQRAAMNASQAAAYKAQADADKAAKKAREDADKKFKADTKAAEDKFEADLAAERKRARDTVLKDEEAWRKTREDRALEEAAKKAQAERSFTESFVAEMQARKSFEATSDKERVANFNSTLSQISTLQQSSNKELFAVGKAAAIAQATISTYQAATVALASAPPPFNYALAAAVTVAGLLNVQKISSQSAPSAGKFATGGIVPGASFTGDKLTAQVNSGEAIFTVGQQKELFRLAKGGAGEGSSGEGIGQRMDALIAAIAGQPIVVSVDGEVIATAVRAQVRGGFDLGTA